MYFLGVAIIFTRLIFTEIYKESRSEKQNAYLIEETDRRDPKRIDASGSECSLTSRYLKRIRVHECLLISH